VSAKQKDPLAWYMSPDIRVHLFIPFAVLVVHVLTPLFF